MDATRSTNTFGVDAAATAPTAAGPAATGPAATAAPPVDPRIKQKGQGKTARIPIKIVPIQDILRKPDWIRAKPPLISSRFYEIKKILREQ